MIRLATFLALLGGYVAVIGLAGMPLVTRRTDFLFVAGAIVACFWDATPSRASLPSTSFLAESVLGGTALMAIAVAIRFGLGLK
jgi:hypothetical protein